MGILMFLQQKITLYNAYDPMQEKNYEIFTFDFYVFLLWRFQDLRYIGR